MRVENGRKRQARDSFTSLLPLMASLAGSSSGRPQLWAQVIPLLPVTSPAQSNLSAGTSLRVPSCDTCKKGEKKVPTGGDILSMTKVQRDDKVRQVCVLHGGQHG